LLLETVLEVQIRRVLNLSGNSDEIEILVESLYFSDEVPGGVIYALVRKSDGSTVEVVITPEIQERTLLEMGLYERFQKISANELVRTVIEWVLRERGIERDQIGEVYHSSLGIGYYVECAVYPPYPRRWWEFVSNGDIFAAES
jgi:hypothetical protein